MAIDGTSLPPDIEITKHGCGENFPLEDDSEELDDAPEDVRTEILRINSEARNLSLQVALLVSVLASLIGLLNSLRMRRLPDIAPSAPLEGTVLG